MAESLRRRAIVTIVGAGGVGKTRLALELAGDQVFRSRDVRLADLAGASGPDEVLAELARAVGVATAPELTLEATLKYVSQRRMLIVLDNCEHVLDACAQLVAELAEASPQLRILATSREPLGLAAEVVWRLEPLPAAEATRLFVERARHAQPDFLPGPDAEMAIAGLVARLDCLPLAIELAAAQIAMLTPAEMLSRIEQRQGLPQTHRALTPPRHQTLRRAIEWSYELLEPPEREGFRRLAVFAGPFTADSATEVALERSIDLLARLVSKSLVSAVSNAEQTSYRLLDTVREFALEQLIEAGELERLRERQLQHYGEVAERARRQWVADGSDRLVHALDPEYESVRGVMQWTVEHVPCAGIRLFGATRNLFFRLGQSDGSRLGRALLESCPDQDEFRIDALLGLGQLASALMDRTTATAALVEAAELADRLGEEVRRAWAAFFHGLADALDGSTASAQEYLQRSLMLHRQLGIRLGEARALAVLGVTALASREPARARALFEEALPLYRQEGDAWGEGQCLTFLGVITESTAVNPARATPLLEEAARLLAPIGDATILPIALIGQASVLLASDRPRAIRITAGACAERERIGGRFPPFVRTRIERIEREAERLAHDDRQRLWAEGARLRVNDMIAIAFGGGKARPAAPHGLSSRELEVVELLSSGLANKQIAARLHLSVRTVETHVRNALSKLGLENRTQLATWARERTQ